MSGPQMICGITNEWMDNSEYICHDRQPADKCLPHYQESVCTGHAHWQMLWYYIENNMRW